jgi:hypothetical protein
MAAQSSLQMWLMFLSFALLLVSTSADTAICTTEQVATTPCRCCKMGCWFVVAKSATHELGHIPGEAGEQEAMATLKLIRTCMMEECTSLCTAQIARPFRPSAANSFQLNN